MSLYNPLPNGKIIPSFNPVVQPLSPPLKSGPTISSKFSNSPSSVVTNSLHLVHVSPLSKCCWFRNQDLSPLDRQGGFRQQSLLQSYMVKIIISHGTRDMKSVIYITATNPRVYYSGTIFKPNAEGPYTQLGDVIF